MSLVALVCGGGTCAPGMKPSPPGHTRRTRNRLPRNWLACSSRCSPRGPRPYRACPEAGTSEGRGGGGMIRWATGRRTFVLLVGKVARI